jgi:CheY-like chemotaxis protein
MTLAPELHRVRADASQMEQVVLNLVVNARDAMPRGGKLTISTRNIVLDDAYAATQPQVSPGPHVVLTVSDNGEGMDTATLERVFEPFFTTKDVGQGTGLGLATVHGIVRQSSGHIAVDSAPGLGATFKVFLPAVEIDVQTSASADPAPQALAACGETVLICEDDPSVRQLTTQMLRSAGYHVLTAATGAAALKVARQLQAPIDLLVTDVIMPEMNGRQVAHTLAAERPGMRTLYISGYTSDVIAHQGVADGNIEFLEKPFSQAELLRRVREVLDGTAPSAGNG